MNTSSEKPLWIYSQKGDVLTPVTGPLVLCNSNSVCMYSTESSAPIVELGTYSSHEEAMEVMFNIAKANQSNEDIFIMPKPKAAQSKNADASGAGGGDYAEFMRQCHILSMELRKRGLSSGGTIGYHSGLFDEAADAIEELLKKLGERTNNN